MTLKVLVLGRFLGGNNVGVPYGLEGHADAHRQHARQVETHQDHPGYSRSVEGEAGSCRPQNGRWDASRPPHKTIAESWRSAESGAGRELKGAERGVPNSEELDDRGRLPVP